MVKDMKKIVFVVPILLLTGCTSDLSIGPIGLLDIIILAISTIILLLVGLERFGPSKFSLSACHSALSYTLFYTLFAVGLIVGSVGSIVVGLSGMMDIVLNIISLILIFGALFTAYRAFKEERRRKNETQTED